MIEIKQEDHFEVTIQIETEGGVLFRQANYDDKGRYYENVVIESKHLPTLISHLIEMGEGAQYVAIPNDLPAEKVWEYVNQHFHLVPKKKI